MEGDQVMDGAVTDDQMVEDPRADLMKQLLATGAQIYAARAGEMIGNRMYGQVEAIDDAAGLIAMAFDPVYAEAAYARAAEVHEVRTPWPGAVGEPTDGGEPNVGEAGGEPNDGGEPADGEA